MSSITSLSSLSAGLSAVNHPHGHKRGSPAGSIDDSGSDTTPVVPASTQQNLFGNLLQSLERTIGVQSSTAASAAGKTSAITGVPAAASGIAGSNIDVST
jgi:hypothetical protein